MARTSSRVRDLAHSGGYGVHAGHGCQWLLLIARVYTARLTTRLSRIHSRLGEAGSSITPPGAVCPPARLPWDNGPALSNEAHKAASAHTSGRTDGHRLHARQDRCSKR